MILSMTGFGRAEARFGNGKIVAEIKTVNHKFLDITMKLPESMAYLEEKVKELVQKSVARGKVYINLSFDGTPAKGERVSMNKTLAKNYYDEMAALKRYLGIEDAISMDEIITMPGVINYVVTEDVSAKLWPGVKRALEAAIKKLISDREKEGRSIYADIAGRVANMKRMVSVIEKSAHSNIEEYKKKFAEKIRALTNGREIDMGRLEVEAAIYAKTSDISEEITRLDNHIVNLERTLRSGGEIGKKLDFIAQELHREINTVGSKASDFKISKNVIEIKSEVEKIREQVKNLE